MILFSAGGELVIAGEGENDHYDDCDHGDDDVVMAD